MPLSPLPPSSHIKAQLFTLDVSKAGPRYPLLPDPFPEGPDYPGVHHRGGVRGAPGQAGAPGRHRQPHMAPASCQPCACETSQPWPLRWESGCGGALGAAAAAQGTAGSSGTAGRLLPVQAALGQETSGSAPLPHGAATGTRGDLRMQEEGKSEGRELS